MDPKYLQFDGIGKTFPGVTALDSVSFTVGQGSIHALMGENGAGKSTLLKVLSGAHSPTSGRLLIGGKTQVFADTGDALAAGIAVIYQELHLVPEMTVAENIFLGHLPGTKGLLRRGELNERAAAIIRELGEAISPTARVASLAIGQRQMVEIGKALSRGAQVIAFDEPTSSLSAREIQRLFEIIRGLRDQGKVVLYVSHRMEEVFELCDAVTVFRDGKHVETFSDLGRIDDETLVNRMVGRNIADVYGYQAREPGPVSLQVEGVLGPGVTEPVSFTVRKGEVVGFFGLVGAGRSELLRLLFGAEALTAGTIAVDGQAVVLRSPADAINRGIVFCPEDRKKDGIIPRGSVQENINISARRHHLLGGLLIDRRWEAANAARFVDRLTIRTPNLRQLMMNLSGGNQQKTILARWLSENIRVILLDEPTRGIDVGAKAEIYKLIYELAGQGIAVVMVSSDLPEVMGVADRIIVMRTGAVAGEFSRADFNDEQLLTCAFPRQADRSRAAAAIGTIRKLDL